MFVCPRPFSPSRAGCAAHVWPTGYVARARLALRSEALRKGAPRLLAGLRTPATQRSTFPFPLSTPLSLYFNTTFNGNHSCQLLISTASNNAFGLPFFSLLLSHHGLRLDPPDHHSVGTIGLGEHTHRLSVVPQPGRARFDSLNPISIHGSIRAVRFGGDSAAVRFLVGSVCDS